MRDEAVLDTAERGLSTSAPRGSSMPWMSPSPGRQHRESQGLGQCSSPCWDPWHVPSRGAGRQQGPYGFGDLYFYNLSAGIKGGNKAPLQSSL